MSIGYNIAKIVARGGSTMATTFALIQALPDYEAQQKRIKELEAALVECREEIEGLHQDAAGASL
jgi:hypothetical protein